ncbi:MAG: succinyl- alpha subunit [Lasallia pustulata]|uniref:Succinyl-alpha subunit n=1 Tax=Lasallia pustulata TaxID=136370 RepID=A0A5M8PPD0_9LECA|nr:MAG: succinyl- alpha subunit [Lasallia pustulata]
MALIGGVQAAPGRVMGHAGAFVAPGEGDALSKIRALEDAGAVITNHPAKFGEGMKNLLGSSASMKSSVDTVATQRRSMHTIHARPSAQPKAFIPQAQKRSLYIKQSQAFDMLKSYDVPVSEKPATPGEEYLLAVSIDRSNLCPCIVASPPATAEDLYIRARRFPFDYRSGLDNSIIPSIVKHLQLQPSSTAPLTQTLHSLINLFTTKEAFLLETRLSATPSGEIAVTSARFGFDDAAFRSAQRQADVHALRDVTDEVPEEVEAEKDGIVYIKLQGAGTIGTLVNGAGLAMNTVDALTGANIPVANFLDTGGKATAATVAASFRLVLADPRVRALFVNIFGGLTRCDMIAEGVLRAYRELGVAVPVVVRLRGTNEGCGQRVAESGLPLHAFDDFEEAAAKVIELAGGRR